MLIREETESLEEKTFSKYAAFSSRSMGRDKFEKADDIRTVYQRDRDRIIHCKSFRRLMNKTQVFLSPEGDHYRTRLTHTLEVAQIARTIARGLRLNEDLAEAISLGHDLGHTPFGHAGERALDKLMPNGFRHADQSVRVVEKLEKDGKGLNLTKEVRDGIRCHTSGDALTMEGRIVRWADRIAYINHDIDDAISAGCMTEEDIPKDIRTALGDTKSERINTLVLSLLRNTEENKLQMDPVTMEKYETLHKFMYSMVYENPYAKGEENKVPNLISSLYHYFIEHQSDLPDYLRRIAEEDGPETASGDYIAGMTDRFAVEYYENLFVPKSWNIGL